MSGLVGILSRLSAAGLKKAASLAILCFSACDLEVNKSRVGVVSEWSEEHSERKRVSSCLSKFGCSRESPSTSSGAVQELQIQNF